MEAQRLPGRAAQLLDADRVSVEAPAVFRIFPTDASSSSISASERICDRRTAEVLHVGHHGQRRVLPPLGLRQCGGRAGALGSQRRRQSGPMRVVAVCSGSPSTAQWPYHPCCEHAAQARNVKEEFEAEGERGGDGGCCGSTGGGGN